MGGVPYTYTMDPYSDFEPVVPQCEVFGHSKF